jgi:DNA-binding NarL/FixJ family response regulator
MPVRLRSFVHVLIVDLNRERRNALRQACEACACVREVTVVRQVEGVERALLHNQPDIALLAADDAGQLDLSLLPILSSAALPIPVLLSLSCCDSPAVVEALAAGAIGCITPDVAAAEMCQVIESILQGEAVLDPQLTASLLREIRLLSTE